ncbi:unnamed protein product [Knipowitschia caucasica]|uniref:Uncharacterized protein n=1 Tax=Knipowitschia caucasica TaxID=637954 RepID=A0AAV2IU27_KNICA
MSPSFNGDKSSGGTQEKVAIFNVTATAVEKSEGRDQSKADQSGPKTLNTAQRLTVQPAPQLPADGYMRRARALEVAAASWFGQSGHGAGRTGGERPR